MPVSAFLFDIGKVIIDFDFSRTVAEVADRCTAGSADMLLASVTDLTVQLELGKISPDEFLSRVCRRIGFSGNVGEFRSAFEDVFDLNQPMVDFIEEQFVSGIPLFLLSNTNGIHVPYFTARYPVFSRFSGAVYSHEAGCMKPDGEIYRHAIEKLGLVPTETVYIDDLAANCEAGQAFGFQTICYDLNRHEAFLESASCHQVS